MARILTIFCSDSRVSWSEAMQCCIIFTQSFFFIFMFVSVFMSVPYSTSAEIQLCIWLKINIKF